MAQFENDIPLELAIAAHSGTSMVPEKRGASERQSFAEELAQMLAEFQEQAKKGGTEDLVEGEFQRYRQGLAKRYRSYLASRSRCVSWMIAGPSNFPSARMQKRGDISHRRLEEYLGFKAAAARRVIRTLRPDLAPIRSSDADAVERLQRELVALEMRQAFMVAANKIVRAFYKAGCRDAASGEIWTRYVGKMREARANVSEGACRELLQEDFCGRRGFADYQLSNNSASIRRVKERIAHVERLQATPVSEHEWAAARLEDDPPANRVRLFFPGKPAEAVRTALKRSGFRWAPSIGAWQAYRNASSLEVARQQAG